jgi:hypothetical protein
MKSEIAKKAENVILSCQNAEQLKVAENYVKLYELQHKTCIYNDDLLKLYTLLQSTGIMFRSEN